MNRVFKLGLAAVCSVAAISVVSAQGGPQSPQQQAQMAVKLRKAVFDVQSFAFAPMGAMLKGAPFNAQAAQQAGMRIEMTASMIPEVFKFDTRKFMVETKARDGIWANKADFDQKAKDLQMAAENLAAAAMTGDRSMTLRAAGAVGKACGSCHDEFRNK